MDGSKKRRIAGAAAFSATAIASLLGAQPAAADRPPQPPGLAQWCESPASQAFKQGFPIKWEGVRCDQIEEGVVYDWWKKVE